MNKPPCDIEISKIAMFKNKLQEYTQKKRLALPAYRTANEGLHHAPKFRATVCVDGAEYTSKSTFRRLRDAEQDAAKLACECILTNTQQNNDFGSTVQNEPGSNKSILHELTFKKHGDIPKYKTTLGEGKGSFPVYVSKVSVGDKTFTGAEAKNKRDAEQFAARAALDSFLGSDSGDAVNQMMSPKRKHFAAPVKANSSEFNQKKIKTAGAEVPGNASQVNRIVITSAPRSTPATRPVTLAPQSSTPVTRPVTSAPQSSTPVTRPVLRRRPNVPRIGFGMGNAVQGNRKVQQHAYFS
ncbi:hypothetical protein RND81_11G080700 [Saponaria officinalis]|uniref:DRBM domain-containing protein n=1 Tax=Saponaria officinalis TaxID=3572 RepID=A0AAW1HJF4_SAPOF